MNTIQKIIEEKALELFKADVEKIGRRNFILANTELGDFITYFTNKTAGGNLWSIAYGDMILDTVMGNGLGESFIREHLQPKLMDSYIEKVTKDLLDKIEPAYKITIEKI